MGKDLTGVRSPERKLMPDIAGSEHHKPTSLRGIAYKARLKTDYRFRNLYGELTPEFLLTAWKRINKRASSGVDKTTAKEYAKNLSENLDDLAQRLKTKRYKAKLVKRTYIPKENGKQRPLGIPALEDKIVQRAVAMVLEAIYEQDFLTCSYGYRPNRGAQDAVSDLTYQLQFGRFGYVVEADIQGFFDHLDHEWLIQMLALRIDDTAFLRLIRKWLKAGILEPDGMIIHPDTGTPQGGIVSPILANVYLHYTLDLWFDRKVKPQCQGEAILCRYADDWVCAFRFKADADRFYAALPERLAKFHLQVEPTKTHILKFSRFHPEMRRRFSFLGFEFFWFPDRKGTPRVTRRTARKKFRAAVNRMKVWIQENRHKSKRWFFTTVQTKLVGHYQYYGVFGNSRALWDFYEEVKQLLFKWLNRRSQRRSYTWKAFKHMLKHIRLAVPRITERKHVRRCVC
jgi:group II intron reverse transcriptase/maturase